MKAKKQAGPELRPLPDDAHRWNPAMRGAFLKGQRAQAAGEARETCPYGDIRKWDGRLTWSRSFVKTWDDGWRWQQKATEQSS